MRVPLRPQKYILSHQEVHFSGFIHLMQYVMTVHRPELLWSLVSEVQLSQLKEKEVIGSSLWTMGRKGSAGLGKAGSRDFPDIPGALSACHASIGLCVSAPPSPRPSRLQAAEEMTTEVPDVSLG